jgi:tripartite-type tricarboxylate transporter receptor subunit TctC
MKSIRTFLFVVLTALSFAGAAQDFPSHPVRIIVPTAPGTGTDATARFIADRLGKEWSPGVIVENKVGANGSIAAEYVAKSPADGYTLLMGFSGLFANKSLYSNVPYDPVKDFRMLLGVNELYLALVVPANSPYKSVKDLVDAAAKQPGQVTFGSAGSGSTTHLGPALLGSMAKVKFMHVPYKGGGQAMVDTISGQVNFAMTAIATATSQISGGKLRALAVSGPRRAKSWPDVPTISELGYKGYDVASVTYLAAPAGTSDAAATKITAAVDRIIHTPEYQSFLDKQGFEAEATPPAEFPAKAAEEVSHWADIVRVTGAKVD